MSYDYWLFRAPCMITSLTEITDGMKLSRGDWRDEAIAILNRHYTNTTWEYGNSGYTGYIDNVAVNTALYRFSLALAEDDSITTLTINASLRSTTATEVAAIAQALCCIAFDMQTHSRVWPPPAQ